MGLSDYRSGGLCPGTFRFRTVVSNCRVPNYYLERKGARWAHMRNIRIFSIAAFVLIFALPAFAEQKNWFEAYVASHGGCFGVAAYPEMMNMPLSQVMSGKLDLDLFGKPVLQWSDDDIETALRLYSSCQTAAANEAQARLLATKKKLFENKLRNVIMTARNLDAPRKAQQQAKAEPNNAKVETAQASASAGSPPDHGANLSQPTPRPPVVAQNPPTSSSQAQPQAASSVQIVASRALAAVLGSADQQHPRASFGVQVFQKYPSDPAPIVVMNKPAPNSPAGLAGIELGDLLIAMNGQPITSVVDFRQRIEGMAPGTSVSLTIIRDGETKALSVTLGQSSGPQDAVQPCRSFFVASIDAVHSALRSIQQGQLETDLFDKPVLKWSNDDVTRVVSVFHDCAVKIGAKSDAERYEGQFRDVVLEARNLDGQRTARQLSEQAERDKEAADEARGYQSITVETFALDGKDLAAKAAKVLLRGAYVRTGNLDLLYANTKAVMTTKSYGQQQPNVSLLTEDAAREFRQRLLDCRSNPATAQFGCSVTVIGHVTTCTLTNAFGARREEPCVAVADGRQ